MASPLKLRYLIPIFAGATLIVACGKEPQPRSVTQFLEDPIALEAAVVRCAQNRELTRYEAECVNARQAISVIEAREERARAAAFEAESERKREALRRTQAAATEARRLAAEAARQREEAEYLAQFGELPVAEETTESSLEAETGNAPGAVLAEPGNEPEMNSAADGSLQHIEGNNAPTELNAIREELQRRSDASVGEPAQ